MGQGERVNRANVAGVLMRHGVDPDADADTLTALLAARGWQASVEETGRSPAAGPKRYRAVATRPRGVSPYPVHLQQTGRTAAEALAHVLATVLERSERSDGRG